jgi:hypothetical protein
VERLQPSGTLIAGETVDLKPTEFEAVWQAVIDGHLQSFSPEDVPGKYYDYGVTKLCIESRPSRNAALQTTRTSWGRPLKNAGKVKPLYDKLAQLARDRAKKVHLFYLPPPKKEAESGRREE